MVQNEVSIYMQWNPLNIMVLNIAETYYINLFLHRKFKSGSYKENK